MYVTWIWETKVLGGRVHPVKKSSWMTSTPDYTLAL